MEIRIPFRPFTPYTKTGFPGRDVQGLALGVPGKRQFPTRTDQGKHLAKIQLGINSGFKGCWRDIAYGGERRLFLNMQGRNLAAVCLV